MSNEMKSFKLPQEALIEIFGSTDLVKIKLDKEKEPNSTHHLVSALLNGKDVYRHFHPKHEESWTVALLKEDRSVLYPYHALLEATREYVQSVPATQGEYESDKQKPWPLFAYHQVRMGRIRERIKHPQLTDEQLINLYPYVYQIFKEIACESLMRN